eukprot:315329-Rhodomonas_salina.2
MALRRSILALTLYNGGSCPAPAALRRELPESRAGPLRPRYCTPTPRPVLTYGMLLGLARRCPVLAYGLVELLVAIIKDYKSEGAGAAAAGAAGAGGEGGGIAGGAGGGGGAQQKALEDVELAVRVLWKMGMGGGESAAACLGWNGPWVAVEVLGPLKRVALSRGMLRCGVCVGFWDGPSAAKSNTKAGIPSTICTSNTRVSLLIPRKQANTRVQR